jgi:hypothetical protein
VWGFEKANLFQNPIDCYEQSNFKHCNHASSERTPLAQHFV